MESVFETAWTAAQFNNLELLSSIVPSQIDPNFSSHSDTNHIHTLLMSASAHGSKECVVYLLQNGAICKTKNHVGYSALHWAAHTGRAECVQVLLNSECSIEIKTNDGRTPLHIAALRGHIQMIKHLLEMGANINSVSSNGWNSLHYALIGNHRQVVEFLLSSGIENDYLDIDSKSQVELAQKMKRQWYQQLLESNTIKPVLLEEDDEEEEVIVKKSPKKKTRKNVDK